MRFPILLSRARWSVGVVIPARDEEQHIERCIESVIAAIEACKELQSSFIVVVADGCVDRTSELARRALGSRGVVVECAANSPGKARRMGVEAVLAHYSELPSSSLWLANTDADTSVPSDWLYKQLSLAADGTSAIAGIVAVDSFAGHGPNGARRFERDYILHADGTHPHVHGANMGIRGDVYLDVGGWSDLSVGEDHCLWQRVKRRGWPVISSTASVVTTSGRLVGRATGGFADTLRAKLESVADVEVQAGSAL